MSEDNTVRVYHPNGHFEDTQFLKTPILPVVMSDNIQFVQNIQPKSITIDTAHFEGKITFTDSSGKFKYDEANYTTELLNYLRSTYGQHYVGKNNTQLFDLLFAGDSSEANGFLRFNAMKYLSRQGKKKGNERSDILKALHYTLLMLYVYDKEKSEINE